MEFCEECGTRLRSTAEQMQIYDDEGAKGMDAYVCWKTKTRPHRHSTMCLKKSHAAMECFFYLPTHPHPYLDSNLRLKC